MTRLWADLGVLPSGINLGVGVSRGNRGDHEIAPLRVCSM